MKWTRSTGPIAEGEVGQQRLAKRHKRPRTLLGHGCGPVKRNFAKKKKKSDREKEVITNSG